MGKRGPDSELIIQHSVERSGGWLQRRFARRKPDAESVQKLLPKDRAREVGRRSVIRGALALGVWGTLANAVKAATAIEFVVNNSRTAIVPARGERLLPTTSSIVVDLSGQNYAYDDNIDVLTSLSQKGARMKVKLGNKGDSVSDIRKELLRIKKETQLKKMSWFCDSDSWSLAAQVIPLISDEIETELVFLASTPESFSDIKGAPRVIVEALLSSGYGPSATLTGLTDAVQFREAFALYTNPQAASSQTADKQLEWLSEDDKITHDFVRFLGRYNASHAEKMRIVYLLLKNPNKDSYVDESQSVIDFERDDLPLDVVTIGGTNQAHDNIVGNAAAVNAAIREYLARFGRR